MRENMFFGTQDGLVMQMDRTGYDDGTAATHGDAGRRLGDVSGEPSATVVWHQARAVFTSGPGEPFVPQLGGDDRLSITIPPPPPAGAG